MKALVLFLCMGVITSLFAQSKSDSLSYSNFKFKPTLQEDAFEVFLNRLSIVDDTTNARNYLESRFFKDQKPQVGQFQNIMVGNRIFVYSKVHVDDKEYFFFYEPAPNLIPLQIIYLKKQVSILSVLNTLIQKKLL